MTRPRLRVVIAGVTGWAGSALARAVIEQPDLELVAGIARKAAGQSIGAALGVHCEAPIFDTAAAALATKPDVLFEFSKPDAALAHVRAALAAGAHAVVGTSGLSDEEYAGLDAQAREARRGVLACGNFAITAVLLQRFAEMAMKWLPDVELIDFASASKVDVPSGTVRELATRLGRARPADQPPSALPLAALRGPVQTRGASMNSIPVHSVRLPGYVLGVEAIFGTHGQRLHLRHEAGSEAEVYVEGALLAIRKVPGLVGVVRGLDQVMSD